MKTIIKTIKRSSKVAGLVLLLAIPVNLFAQETVESLLDRATASGIDQTRITEVRQRVQERGMSDQEFMSIIQPAIDMADENLPYEMIFEKVLEGLSKGVSTQRMAPVLSSIHENASRSAQFVDRWMQRSEVRKFVERGEGRMEREQFRNEMVKAGSKAMMQNIDEGILIETLNNVSEGNMDKVKPSGLLAAINILGDLPNGSNSASQNARLVLRALQSGFEAGDIQKLPAALNMAQRRSQLPAAAVGKGFMEQIERGFPSERILQNMFNGQVGGGPPGNVPGGIMNERPGRPGGN
ncbi:hypothetical protein [Rhodohalobacter sp.]|uniref:hypothetical protein n=1 Tax=Rhodohalobacter sp. TaxID=1974210 RepID=UPI002ACDCE6F|nr:hypothetical protein [Rhodohalobacter sp.]MDZ7756571.1 hypothetical protein [Rhodohalobacter sp.]